MMLNSSGYRSMGAETLKDAAQIILNEPVDVLILCHTISESDCRRALALPVSATTKVLILNSGPCGHGPKLCEEFAFLNPLDTSDGPGRLISTLDQLVHPSTHCLPGSQLGH